MENIQQQNSNKITFSILGACILRDAWGMGHDFGEFHLNQFIQSNSPFSCFCLPFSEITNQSVLPEDMPNTSPALYKWFCINAEKTLEQNLAENKADWLIVGLTEVRDPIVKIQNTEGKFTFLDHSKAIFANKLFETNKFKNLKTIRVEPSAFLNELTSDGRIASIVKFEELILKYYSPDRIIFVDIQPAISYISKNNTLINFDNSILTPMFDLIDKCSKQFIDDIKPHVVKVPRNVLADENHKWGISFFHYQSELYDYLNTCFTYIMKNNLDEKQKLLELFVNYEDLFSKKHLYNSYISDAEKKLSTVKKYLTARIDLKNHGKINNAIEFVESSDENAWHDCPSWFAQKDGKGFIIQSSVGMIDFDVKCIGSGDLRFWLKGVDVRDKNGVRFPIWINYISCTVDGEQILREPKLVCHDKPFEFTIKKVKDNQVVKIHAEWKPFDSTAEYKY